MSVDTTGKIKGFIRYEEILNFVRQKYDVNATAHVDKRTMGPLTKYDFDFQVNEHSEDTENWYTISGYISFSDGKDKRTLFYSYNNINTFENLSFYQKYGLENMVKSETTSLILGRWGNSVPIMKEIIAHFGGGWIDEDDCDDEEYYPVKGEKDENIQPVKYVTMDEIREKFGCDVVIIESKDE